MITTVKGWCGKWGGTVKWNFNERTVEDIARKGK